MTPGSVLAPSFATGELESLQMQLAEEQRFNPGLGVAHKGKLDSDPREIHAKGGRDAAGAPVLREAGGPCLGLSQEPGLADALTADLWLQTQEGLCSIAAILRSPQF